MLRPLLLPLSLFVGLYGMAQPARIIFNSAATTVNQHPFVVFNPEPDPVANPGAYLVIDNPNANAITLVGAVTSNVPIIKSETEQNKIRWAIGASTGTYVIPFASGTTAAGVAMPLTVQKTSAGAGAGSIIFSTYNTLGKVGAAAAVNLGWNNELYRPSDVTHVNDYLTGLTNNSAQAIDRFWIIDAGEVPYAYTTRPDVNITFKFDPAEAQANAGNVFDPNLLMAQRFNSTLNKWFDILQMGTTGTGEVAGAAPPTPADFFRSWTLASSYMPLPITLVSWEGRCEGRTISLEWTTASELNNAYFTIEKSRDAGTWSAIGTVPGAGNSSSMISYSFTDDNAADGLAYYRLRQTDFNGTTEVSATIAVGCGVEHGTSIVNAWDDGEYLNLVVSSTQDGVYDLTLTDAQGKVMTVQAAQVINTGATTLQVDKRGIATGIYMVQLLNNTHMLSRRVHLH